MIGKKIDHNEQVHQISGNEHSYIHDALLVIVLLSCPICPTAVCLLCSPISSIALGVITQPTQPVAGSTVKQKLDIGFVEEPHAMLDKRYKWLQILVLGELKND
ncbi:hypothetical protein CIRG_07647 [Coccidioides immitis RMSCC 2394]|uniref:Uncharacterized protein n=1 Tax=Coccidioides immitis RMSCC 2394 TaxID=404692 RepID=A0A0J6YGZ1_COCIT|nr:hypothetical protein CIRG_07647 [Coccidioides immitis RMSCC 2394]